MKAHKFLSLVFVITSFSLLYVYQRTEIFRLGYVGQKKLTVFQDLLDHNTILRYNIEKKASLVQIGDKVSKSASFQMPDSYRLVRLARSSVNSRIKPQLAERENIVSRFFGIKRQAEAKTINP